MCLRFIDMGRLLTTDSGSVERLIKRLFATDIGSVEREIKRLFLIDSGGIARLIFRGIRVQLVAGIHQGNSLSPTDALCQYRLLDTGAEQVDTGSGFSTIGTWLLDGVGGDYDVRYTFTGDTGDVILGNNGVWENLSVSRLWAIQDTGPVGAAKEITGTIEIRDKISLDVLESEILTLRALESS